MADLQQAMQALRNAHNAGDVEAATRLAGIVRKLQSTPQRPPSGASAADRLRELYASRPAYEAPPRDSTMTEEFMRTLRGTLSSGRTGIASLLGDADAQALAGLERSEAISQDYGVAPSLEQVKETYGEEGLLAAIAEGARQVPRFVTQQLPTLAQAIAGAKAGAMIPGPPQLKAAGAIAGGVGAFLPTFAGSNIERLAQEQQGAGEAIDVDVGGAYGTALAQSGLQGVGAAAVLGKNIVRGVLGIAAKDVPEEVAEQGLRTLAERGVLNNIARRGVTGAAGEVPTEVAQQILERNYAGLPLADEEAMAEYGEAAYASAIGGGVLGGATGIRDRSINRGNLEAFEAAKLVSDTQIVGADGTVKGRMILTRLPNGNVIRQNIDAKGEIFGTDEYSGEQAVNIFAYGKGKERGRAPINENDLVSQGFVADKKKEEAVDQEIGEPGATLSANDIDTALKEFDDRTGGMPDVPVKPLTARQLTIQAAIEAEAAKQGVTLTPEELRRTALFADRKNDADLPGAIAARVAKIGKPITPAADKAAADKAAADKAAADKAAADKAAADKAAADKAAADKAAADKAAAEQAAATPPTGTETTPPPPPTGGGIKIDQQRDERFKQEGTTETTPPPPPPPLKERAPSVKFTGKQGYASNESVSASLREIEQDDDIALEFEDRVGAVMLENINRSWDGKKGRATAVLKEITNWADANNKPLVLMPSGQIDGSKDELKAWYERNGFVVQPDGAMVRQPTTPPTGTITPDKTRSQQALESDDLGRVYDALRVEQESTRVTAEDTPQLNKINAELSTTFDEIRDLRIKRQKDEDEKVFDSDEQKKAKRDAYDAAMKELDKKVEQLYTDKLKARGSRAADTPLIKQLRDKADELYAKKYPGISTVEQAELESLYEQNAEIQARTDLEKAQKKELRAPNIDRITEIENKRSSLSPEALAKAEEKRRASVSEEVIVAMKEDKATVNRTLGLVRGPAGFAQLAPYVRLDGLDFGLRALAYDLALDPTLRPKPKGKLTKEEQKASQAEKKADADAFKRALRAQDYVKKNLSKPANRALEAQVKEFRDMNARGDALSEAKDARLIARNNQREAEEKLIAEGNKEIEEQAEEDLKNPSLRQLAANPVDKAEEIASAQDDVSARSDTKASEQALVSDLGLVDATIGAEGSQGTMGDLGLFRNYEKVVASEAIGYVDPDYLAVDAVAASSVPMTEAQIDVAKRGDLSGVMQNIEDTNDNKDVRQLAKALKANIGDTKLEVVDGLTDANGKQVAGLFDPKTNTIKLNSRVMLRPHTIMHETAHAATSHTLKNKSHPVTKALTKLFNDVKAQLDTEYGATTLDEFVAEVFSNVQFRQKLAAIMVTAGDGKQITAFQRFKNAVGNLLRTLMGRSTVSLDRKEDALTQADALIRNILSPAPNVRNAPELYSMLANGGKESETVMRVMLAPFRGASTKIDPQALAKARAVLAPMSRARVQAMTYLLPLNAQIELAKDIIPSAKELFEVLQRKKGTRDNEMQKVTDLKKTLESVFKNKLEQRNIFNDVVAYSTLVKVDPSLTKAQAKEKYGDDKQKMADYEDMTKKYWSKLSPAQQAAYKELRDYYADGYQKIRALIDKRIEEFSMDGDQKAKLKDLLLKDVLSKESIEPYFPLSRSGKFWLEYSGVSPFTGKVEHYKEAFDSETERNIAREEQRNNTARINQLKARWTGKKEQLEEALEVKSYERAQNDSKLEKVPTGFAYRILNEMKAAKAPADVQKMITEMLLNAMPENSLARMFKPRAGTMGFKVDALTVLQDRSPSIITQVTNLEFDGPLSKLLTKMKADVEKSDNPHKEVWLESFTSYIDYSRTPFIAPWSRRLKSLGFMFTLGFNVSSVLVNMTNPAVVTYPYLGGQFGFDKALKAMLNAHSVYMGAGGKKTGIPYVTKRRSSYDLKHMDKLNEEGKNEGVETEIFSAPNLSNIDFSDLSKVPKEYRHYAALEEAMRNRGQSNRSLLTEINEFADPKIGVLGKLDGYMAKLTNLSGLMFHQGERLNRSVSAIAAYNLKLEDLLKGRPVSSATDAEMAKAADYAIEATEFTNSGSMAETAPRISQGSLGSVVFMYKRFGVSMLYLQFRMFRQAIKAGKLNERERIIARRQMLGLFLTSGAIAGIRGMPMVGLIIWLWNMTREEDEEDADTILQNYVGEGPFNGLLNYVFGLDIAPRIGMTDLLFRSLPNQESTSLADTAFNMAGPIAGIANRVYDGWGLMMDGEMYRGAERMMPAVIAGGMKAARYSGEGATTLRGDPITEDIHPGHVIGQALGFAPAGYTRQLERNALVKRVDRNISESRTRLMRRYYLAMRENDFNALLEVQQEMLDFSLKHPEVAITPDSINASIRQHRVTDEMARQLGGITVNRRRFATVLQENMEAGF